MTRPPAAEVIRSPPPDAREQRRPSARRRVGALAGALVHACHPEPTAAVTALGTALAVSAGRPAGGVLGVALAVLTGQLSVGWSNDYLDRERDRLANRADKPVAGGVPPPRVVAVAALVALAACVPLSFASGWRAGCAHLAAVALAWSYNLGLKATALSVVPYLLAFALLPAFVVLGLPGHPAPPWWALAGGALLGAGAHFANVLPDLTDDLRTGVHGLPHRLGQRRSRGAAAVLVLAASAVVALGPGRPGPLPVAGLALATVLVVAGIAADRGGKGVGAFRVTIAVALIDVALFVAAGRSLA
ncbi:UbiA family prenyltransferase [Frankia nepalensis]|uniref:UbiA family prenyltransferase n=1 Tax=Frankia nepalensis TaxID=1836974 RepID=UPI0027DDA40F|nr:UbiA family prenyltransferase [Frankia nepalensis]